MALNYNHEYGKKFKWKVWVRSNSNGVSTQSLHYKMLTILLVIYKQSTYLLLELNIFLIFAYIISTDDKQLIHYTILIIFSHITSE